LLDKILLSGPKGQSLDALNHNKNK